MRFQIFLTLAVFAVSIELAAAYPNGLVSASCENMKPNHGVEPQTIQSPYSVSVSKYSYSPGDSITVTIATTNNSSPFLGFMVQARVIGQNEPVGYFRSFDSNTSRSLDCNSSPNSSVSQRTSVEKTQQRMTWEAPRNTSLGDIVFCATFVKSKSIFWDFVGSPTVKMAYSSSFELNFPPSKYTLLAVTGLKLFLNHY